MVKRPSPHPNSSARSRESARQHFSTLLQLEFPKAPQSDSVADAGFNDPVVVALAAARAAADEAIADRAAPPALPSDLPPPGSEAHQRLVRELFATLRSIDLGHPADGRAFDRGELNRILPYESTWVWADSVIAQAVRMTAQEAREYLRSQLVADDEEESLLYLLHECLSGSYGYLNAGDEDFIKYSFEAFRREWDDSRNFIRFIGDRLNGEKHSDHSPTAAERAKRLYAYALLHGDNGLEKYARLLFPEWLVFQEVTSPTAPRDLPTVAPERYQGLRGPESPPDFVQRVYEPWLGKGLHRGHIRNLDKPLWQAITNWSRNNEWPADVDLPTVKQQNDRDIAAVIGGEPKLLGKFSAREAARIGAALGRRGI